MASPQPQQEQKSRVDPKPRLNDGGLSAVQLKNKKKDRHYVWVSMEGDAVNDYVYLGYEKEKFAANAFRDGEDITSKGHVLMSCPISVKSEIDASGWAITDGYERRMVSKKQVVADTMRGISARPQHVSVESEIGGLEPVR